jgi:acyl-CoA synthetase (NDP forming)/RimJ/RimL family protein N-acetyltransferase
VTADRTTTSRAGGGEVSPEDLLQAGTYALLTDGSTVEIRHARPDDARAVQAMHAAMSADNFYLRFFSLSPRSAETEARRVCREPGPDHAALLAWLGSRLVGVASYELAKPETAEVAFAVPDDLHGRGIATLLLEHLVSIARERGLHAFTAETLADNTAMLAVFSGAGLPVRRRSADGVVELTFPLPEGEADGLGSYLDSVAARESRADVATMRHLLAPASVAVIGASRRRGTVGREILQNIVGSGFAGEIYPVNPRASSLAGLRCLASAADLPEHVDVAVIAVPAAAVPAVAEQCGQRGVRSLVVITSGLGAQGADLLASCRRHGMRLVGPNCFGIAVPGIGLDATFGKGHPTAGIAGLVVQSGGIGVSLLDHLSRLGIGVSSFASVGDKYDVSSNDMLTWWEQDGQTRLAVLYVESFGSPRKFGRTARRVGNRMPVLTVIGGRSAAGQRAAASHTAAAATPLVTQEALFGQAGVIAVTGLGELVETIAMLAGQPLPAGNRVAIVTNAGGAGVLAADACGDNGLQVARLSSATRRKLTRLLPAGAVVTGPVDTTAAVSEAVFRGCLAEVAADQEVDALLVVAVPTALADLRKAVSAAAVGKPLVACMLDQQETVAMLPQLGAPSPGQAAKPATPGPGPAGALDDQAGERAVPVYAYPEGAARALGHAAKYRRWREQPPGQVPYLGGVRAAEARAHLGRFLASHPGGGWLPPATVGDLLQCYQIPLVDTRLAVDEQAAVAAAAELGGPVVLKADVPGLVHKTEAGAVKLYLRDEQEVRAAYQDLSAAFGQDLTAVLVQPMLTGGVEVLIGVVQEEVFGPLVVFGLGGVATDVLGDHAAKLTPLTDVDADDLIHGVHAAPLLFGHRGSPPVDTTALRDMLLRVSRLAEDLHEVSELDLNPVIATSTGAHAVDARIRVSPAQPRDPFLRRLR